jgi:hypothetical protein
MNKDQTDVSHIDKGEINEPVAVRYDFDGNGYLYMDAGSGSDWASRVKDCEFLYTHPMRNNEDDDIFRKEQVEKFYAEARPLREKYKPRELTDEEIREISHKALEQSGFTKETNFMVVFARAIIKASRGEK